MGKLTILLGIVLVTLTAETTCKKKFPPLILPPLHRGPVRILPNYKPPLKRGHVVRTVREVQDPEPLWLYQDKNIDRAPSTGDHPLLPSIIDDINLDPNRRTARSVDSPSAKRGGGSSRGSSRSSDTGPTHPGYNRRNARSVSMPPIFDPFTPSPTFPRPQFPGPRLPLDRRPLPIYARTARDVSIADVVRKPTHRDVIIPNWNPNARVNPWQRIGGNARRPRSVEELNEFADVEDTNGVEHEE